jgi:hypothetical protein
MDDLDYVQMMVSLGACDDLSVDDSWKYANAGVSGPQCERKNVNITSFLV